MEQMKNHYDVIVIGSGPGGEGAAMKCTKEGLHVAMCDYFSMVGGSCTHTSTIPSKALRHASVSSILN
jgi:NAD(P) transhydrogenase